MEHDEPFLHHRQKVRQNGVDRLLGIDRSDDYRLFVSDSKETSAMDFPAGAVAHDAVPNGRTGDTTLFKEMHNGLIERTALPRVCVFDEDLQVLPRGAGHTVAFLRSTR